MNRLIIVPVAAFLWGAALSAQNDSDALRGCSGQTATSVISEATQPSITPHDHAASVGESRTVTLLVKFSDSGKVRRVKVLNGPVELRRAAINAVNGQSYVVKRKSRELRKIELAVWFSANDSNVAGIGQLWPGPNGPAFVNIPETVETGVLGCVPTPAMVKVGQHIMETLLVKKVDPAYPRSARAKHISGTVTLYVHIDEQGNVTRAAKVSGSNFLVAAAVDAVMQWKYRPFTLNGTPIKVVTFVDVTFAPQS